MTPETIAPRQANALLTQGATLIDIRDADEYRYEHILQAQLAPLATLQQQGLPDDKKAAQIIFHCQSGKRTQTNAATLQAVAAPARVYLLEGGIEGWKAAGLPVEKSASQSLPLMRQVHIAAGGLVLLGVGLGYLVHSGFFLLSAFAGVGLLVAGITGFCGMARLLARMPWNQPTH